MYLVALGVLSIHGDALKSKPFLEAGQLYSKRDEIIATVSLWEGTVPASAHLRTKSLLLWRLIRECKVSPFYILKQNVFTFRR